MSYVPDKGEKPCTRCKEVKSVHEFRIFKAYGDEDKEYRRSWCHKCEIEYGREWRVKNPRYHAEKSKEYRDMVV